MIRMNLIGGKKELSEKLQDKLTGVLMSICPPVTKYPMKHPREWREVGKSHDPLRPLEAGEDWAGNVQTPFLRLDVEKDGRVHVKVNRFMKAVHIVRLDDRRRQIVAVTNDRRKSAMLVKFGG